MGQSQTARQSQDRRVKNFSEVSLGYPKAVSLTEARRCPQCAQPTCMNGCPLGIDIPGFIRLLREGDAVGALNRIKESNPLPGVCGRICLAPCETACVFHDEGSAIGIRALERFAADNGRSRNPAHKNTANAPSGKKVAIVGSGPAALSAAAYLSRKGFNVAIYEALAKPGGALRYGVPEFRLPSKVLDAEIHDIQSQGVEIHTGVVIGKTMTVDELTAGHDAILLATGSGSPGPGTMAGDHLIGVYFASEFLMRLNLFNAHTYPKTPTPALIGSRVAVLGSGPVALDCARLVLRMGKKVTIIYPGMAEEMDVCRAECKDAQEEGLVIESLIRPLEILPTAGHTIAGIRCERLDFSDDAAGRWEIKTVPNSEFVMDVDTVILTGASTPLGALKNVFSDIRFTQNGMVWIEPQTGKTSIEKIFAAGDVTTGGGILVDAIAGGQRAARNIEIFLNG